MLAPFKPTTSIRSGHSREANQQMVHVPTQTFSKQLLVMLFEVQNVMDHFVSEQAFCCEQGSYFC